MSGYNRTPTLMSFKDNPKVPGLRDSAPPSPIVIRHLLPDGTIGPVEKVIPVEPMGKLKRKGARIYTEGVKI